MREQRDLADKVLSGVPNELYREFVGKGKGLKEAIELVEKVYRQQGGPEEDGPSE